MTKPDIEISNENLKVVIVDTGDPADEGICWVDVYFWDEEYNDWSDEPTSAYSNIEADATDEEKKQYAEQILKKLVNANPNVGFGHRLEMAI